MNASTWGPIAAQAGGALLGGMFGQQQARDLPTHLNSGTSSQNWSQTTPHPIQTPFYGMLGGGGKQMGQTPTPFFPGQTYVGPSTPTQYGMNTGMDVASRFMPGVLGTAGSNYNFLSGAADVANNPYVQAMNQNTTSNLNRNFSENLLPGINAGANQVNAMGSGRHGIAQGVGMGQTQQAIGDATTKTNLGAYGQGLQAQQGALQQTGNMLQNMMMPSQAMMGLGGVAEGYQQDALNDAMARFQHQYSEPWQRMGNVQNLMSAFNPLARTQSAGSGTTSSPNPNWMSPTQGAMAGAGMGGGLGQQFGGMFSNMFGGGGGTGGNYTTGGQTFTPSQYRTWM